MYRNCGVTLIDSVVNFLAGIADVSSVSPSSEGNDEGLTLETQLSKSFTVVI